MKPGAWNDLVGDMVDLSKPRRPRAEATDIAGHARDVVALAANAARGSDVEVAYEGPERETVVRCDGPQMRQVLWNLVRNAIQASSAGSTVTVRVEPRERDVTLTVEDQGEGSRRPSPSRIFDDFFTTRTHGAGIGLAARSSHPAGPRAHGRQAGGPESPRWRRELSSLAESRCGGPAQELQTSQPQLELMRRN